MNGVKTAQLDMRGQRRCAIENLRTQKYLVDSRKLTPRVCDSGRSTGEDGSHHFHSRKCARHGLVRTMTTQEASKGIGLRLSLDELHQCGGVKVEPQRS